MVELYCKITISLFLIGVVATLAGIMLDTMAGYFSPWAKLVEIGLVMVGAGTLLGLFAALAQVWFGA